jgi:hypothetical protein
VGGLVFDEIVRHRHNSVSYLSLASADYRAGVAGRTPSLALALMAVIAGVSAGAPRMDSQQPVPCPPCFVCIQTGIDVGRIPQPECPLPRS